MAIPDNNNRTLEYFIWDKVLRQGKLIAVAFTLRTYWNQIKTIHQLSFLVGHPVVQF